MPPDDSNAELHRYGSGRYQLKQGPLQVVFTEVERTDIRGNFKLLDSNGEQVGFVDRVAVSNEVMHALDDVTDGDHLDPDEWVPPQESEEDDE